MDPFSHLPRTHSPPKPPGSGQLRNIIMPRPKPPSLAASLPPAPTPPVVSFPSHLPIRKRLSAELLDENESIESVPPAGERPYVRQRVHSGASLASIASVETIRADARGRAIQPMRGATRVGTNTTRPKSRSRSKPRRGAPLRALSPDPNFQLPCRTLDASLGAATKDAAVVHSYAATAVGPVAGVAAQPPKALAILTQERAPIERPSCPAPRPSQSSRLRRTVSHRSLAHRNGKSFDVPSTEGDFLSEKDKAIVRSVVASIVEANEDGDATPGDPDSLPEIPDEEEAIPDSCAEPVLSQKTADVEKSRFKAIIRPVEGKHCTMWDVKDSDYYAWQGYLAVEDYEPPVTSFGPRKPIQMVNIEFESLDAEHGASQKDSRRTSKHYATKWMGQMLDKPRVRHLMRHDRGICIEPEWTQWEPTAPGSAPGGMWVLRFWVPVPMALFRRCESKMFRLRAKVELSDWDVPRTIVMAQDLDVSIEHLRKEKVMKKRK